jgi:uncharacterized protein
MMIKNTFLFLPGFSEAKEKNLWKQGIHTWNDFLNNLEIKGISHEKKRKYDEILEDAKKRLFLEDFSYFAQTLPLSQHWRLYDYLKEDAFYLDIETSDNNRNISVVGLFDGFETLMFVNGINFSRDKFTQTLAERNMVITFNGASFDIPKLEKYFSFKYEMPHIDLRHVCYKIGLKHGLKNIEKELGIERSEETHLLRGHNAVELWKMWKTTGDQYFLDLLIKYNEEDIINLKQVADYAIPRLWEKVRTIS